MIEYYILDLETTGLDSKRQEINEISVIRVKDKNQLTRNIKALYPERASIDALRVQNRTMNDLLVRGG